MSARGMAALAAAVMVGLCAPAHANLLVNGGAEEPLVGGELPGWTEVVGGNWTRRSANPQAHEGQHYFFAGAGATATLRQDVDVSAWAADIDAGVFTFAFSGWVRSFAQTPADQSQIVVTWLAAAGETLHSFDSGLHDNTDAWHQVWTLVLGPAGTRSVRIELTSLRRAGTNNDGYFDGLVLERVLPQIPEAGTAALMLLGLGALALRGRGAAGTGRTA